MRLCPRKQNISSRATRREKVSIARNAETLSALFSKVLALSKNLIHRTFWNGLSYISCSRCLRSSLLWDSRKHVLLGKQLVAHVGTSSPLGPLSRQINELSYSLDQICADTSNATYQCSLQNPKKCLTCIRLWHRKVQNQNFSRPCFELMTCPVRE